MKRHLFPLLLLVAAATGLPTFRAQAQDNKPVLNSAPPGPPPARPTAPVPAPEPTPAPASAPAPATPLPEPTTAPDANAPSGLELPGREKERKAAQDKAETNTRFFIYSGFGLGYSSAYGTSQFDISASPALGIRLTDRLAVGPGLSYAYSNIGFSNQSGQSTGSLSTKSVGVKVFGQFRVIDQFLIHGEFENTRAQLLEIDPSGRYYTGRVITRTVQTPLAGVGYRQQFSNRAAADILVLYNFQDDFNRIYSNPVIRFNFLFNIGK